MMDRDQNGTDGNQPTLRVRQERHRNDSSGIPRYGSQAEIKFDGIVEESQRMEEAEDERRERELFNFASAPINAKSALNGNKPLKERYERLQEELKEKGVR